MKWGDPWPGNIDAEKNERDSVSSNSSTVRHSVCGTLPKPFAAKNRRAPCPWQKGAFAAANDPATEAAARRLVIEAHFRLAAATTSDRQRLHHLDTALEFDPAAFRLRYHRAVTLCRLGRVAEAVPEFEALAAQDASRRDVATLYQLARAAMGQSGANDATAAAKADRLQTVLNDQPGVEAQGPDEPVQDDAAVLWQTLRRMMGRPKAAPVAQLRTLADSLEPTGAGTLAQYYLGVAAMRGRRRGDRADGLAGSGRGRHGDPVVGRQP